MESYRIAQIATVLHNLSTTATVAEEILSNHDGVRRLISSSSLSPVLHSVSSFY